MTKDNEEVRMCYICCGNGIHNDGVDYVECPNCKGFGHVIVKRTWED